MKTWMFIILSAFISISLQAEEAHKHHKNDGHKHEGSTAEVVSSTATETTIKVKGMVCAFCAQGITKNFKSEKEVEDVKVDLDKMEVHLRFKKGQKLSRAKMKEIITGAGFDFVGEVSE